MERAASALCVVPAQCGQVLRICFVSCGMRSGCEFTRLAAYGCLGQQQAEGSSASVGECECNGCVVW